MSPMRCFFPFKQQAPQSYQRRLLGNQERGKYPGEWTPALKEYVRKAFDPANSVPGWTRAAIQKELETMIYMNRGQDSSNCFRWRTMDLPQHIDPQYLPYGRDPRDRGKDIAVRSPAPTSKMYPRNSVPHTRIQSLCLHTTLGNFSFLIETVGNCWFIRMVLV